MKRLPCVWFLASALAFGCSDREMVTFSDFCPEQPDEVPGVCGCGVLDVIDPATGSIVCDFCPDDPAKTEPGVCGCGVPDVDANGNTIMDCLEEGMVDLCPDDPAKTEPGVCGCGMPEVIDPATGMCDLCPDDPAKTEPGVCGCGVPDVIDPATGSVVCEDLCPDDPAKTEPGVCGCGVPDVIDPATGSVVCEDLCPDDPAKVAPGVCGCGVREVIDPETGGCDFCPRDPAKIEPGVCGCGVADLIDPVTGSIVCEDLCPLDPAKTEPGVCGCGVPDTPGEDGSMVCLEDCDVLDWDGDGVIDAEDACPYNPNITHASQGDCNVVMVDGSPQFQIWNAQDLLVMRAVLEDTSNPPTWTEAVIMRDLNLRDLIDPDPSVACKAQTCDVSWVPIHFAGKKLSGRSHTIRFQYLDGAVNRCQFTTPLFGMITNATVTDLALDYDVGGNSVASLVAEVRGSTLTNIQYRGDFATEHKPLVYPYIHVGGIVARSSESTLRDIAFEGNFAVHNAGGSIGSIIGDSQGDIVVTKIRTKIGHFHVTGNATVGGMFGSLNSAGAGVFLGVSTFDNHIEVMTRDSDAYGRIGGVAGLIANCGALWVNNFIGSMELGRSSPGGGLVGELSGGMLNMVNNRIGTMKGGVTSVGGLAGSVYGQSSVLRVNNDVSRMEALGFYVGGLLGAVDAFEGNEVWVYDVRNSVGDVFSLGENVGGLVGSMADYGGKVGVEYVHNRVLEVKGRGSVGGLVGSIGTIAGVITMEGVASEVGRVEGVDSVGGILGHISSTGEPQPPSVLRLSQISSQAPVFAERTGAGVIGGITFTSHTPKEIDLSYIYSSAKVEAGGASAAGIGRIYAPMQVEPFVSWHRVYYHPWPEFAASAFFEPSTDNAATQSLLQASSCRFAVCIWESGTTGIYGAPLDVLGLRMIEFGP